MKNTLKIDFAKKQIIMDRTFAKNVENTNSEEYAHLQQVRKDYPTYTVVARQIKRNPNKETYKGLTYEYMRAYIVTHEPVEKRKAAIMEFEELILISQCHSQAKRYPVIKKWFLDRYSEIAEFGITKEAEGKKIAQVPVTTEENNVEYAKAS